METVGQNSAVLQGGVAQGAAEGGVRGGRGRAAVGEALGLGEPARHVYTAWRLWPGGGWRGSAAYQVLTATPDCFI